MQAMTNDNVADVLNAVGTNAVLSFRYSHSEACPVGFTNHYTGYCGYLSAEELGKAADPVEVVEAVLADQMLGSIATTRGYYRGLVLRLIEKWVPGWTLRITTSVKVLGRCVYRDKAIELSYHLLDNVPEKVVDTALHEIAHALTPGDEHGPRWVAACKRIGALPEQYYRGGMIAPPKYAIYCVACDRQLAYRYLKVSLEYKCCAHCKAELQLVPLTPAQAADVMKDFV